MDSERIGSKGHWERGRERREGEKGGGEVEIESGRGEVEERREWLDKESEKKRGIRGHL